MKTHHKVIASIIGAAALGTVAYVHTLTPSVVLPLRSPTADAQPKAGPAAIYPDPLKTPGAINTDITQDTIAQTICNPSWSTKSIRPPVSYTSPLKAKEIAAGYTYNGDTNSADYELDHLISLELGGNPTSELNLWPEPYHTMVGNVEIGAHQKDTVENYLHKQVCAGAITLVQAQQDIVTDWYAGFKMISTSPMMGAIGSQSSGQDDPDDN